MERQSLPSLHSRRQVLQGLAAASASALLSGCTQAINPGAAGNSPQAAVSNPQPVPLGSITQASLVVSSTTVGAIAAGFTGLSYEKSALCGPLFTGSNSDLIGLFQRLGPSVLRIGGNAVDQCVWMLEGAGRTAGQIAPSDVAALADFVKAAGWKCIYGVNLGGAAKGITTPSLAAAEVSYAAQQLGDALLGIEIGNECDFYGASTSYFPGNWSLAQFETLWQQFRTAILEAAPGVPVAGPASASNLATWTLPFGQWVTSSKLALLTHHYYRANGLASSSTAQVLLSSDGNLANCLSTLSTGTRSIGVSFRLGECNSYYNGGAPGVSDSYASALWVLDFLFNCAQGGAIGVNLHGGGNYASYTPIADSHGTVLEARPIFYGMTLFTLAGQGTLQQTKVSAGQLNVTAYAVKSPQGSLNLLVVNKDATENLQFAATVPLQPAAAALSAMTQLSPGAAGPSLSATSGVTIQDAGIDPDGTFAPAPAYGIPVNGSRITFYVPALSAVLVQIAA